MEAVLQVEAPNGCYYANDVSILVLMEAVLQAAGLNVNITWDYEFQSLF